MRLESFVLLSIIASFSSSEIVIDLDSDLLNQYSQIYEPLYKNAFRSTAIFLLKQENTQEILKRMDEIKVYLAPFTLTMIKVYSEITGFTENEILSINFILQTFCTSVIVKKPTGGFIFGRNLDYDVNGSLSNLFMEVVFLKNRKQLIKAAGFFGVVPFLNYSYYNQFSVSLNQRVNRQNFEQRLEYLLRGEMDPLFHLYESVMTSNNYTQLFTKLANEKKVSPAYYILCGNKNHEAAIIARGSNNEYVELMGSEDWFLVQANDDRTNCETVVSPELNRKCAAESKLRALGKSNITYKSLYSEIMSTFPNKQRDTVYISIQDHNSYVFFSIIQ